MPRPTLKLTKPRDPAAAKPGSTRARLAQRERKRSISQAAAETGAAPAVPAPAVPPAPQPPPPSSTRAPLGRAPRAAKPRTEREFQRKPRPDRDAQHKPRFDRDSPRKPPAKREFDRKPPVKRDDGRKPPAKREYERNAPHAPRPAAPRPIAARPSTDRDESPRLSKRMSELGLCSRREADEWIESGWVRVDGNVVTTLGVRVSRDARIDIDPAATKLQREQVTIILHKPVGFVSGQPEDGHQSAVVLVKPENHWSEDPSGIRFRPAHLRNLAPAGRLDIDSTGLLVYTQDGRVAKRLVGADSDVEKEYLVRVEGTLSEEGLERLRHGLELDGVKLKPAKVSWSNEDQLRVVLREGRKRQIRRMCETVGLVVTGLKRVRTGGVPLGRLPAGQWRYLARDERF